MRDLRPVGVGLSQIGLLLLSNRGLPCDEFAILIVGQVDVNQLGAGCCSVPVLNSYGYRNDAPLLQPHRILAHV